MRIYLDSCCFNCPYDDQSQRWIAIETQCKLYIQEMIRQGIVELAASYMLSYECGENPYRVRRETIEDFIRRYAVIYVGNERKEYVEGLAAQIMETGIKFKDACHVSAAIYAGCEYFISTDKRLLKYKSTKIGMVNPVEFIIKQEVG